MRLKVIKIIGASLGLVLLNSCYSSRLANVQEEQVYQVINSTFLVHQTDTANIHYKSYVDKQFNHNFIKKELENLLVSYPNTTEIYRNNFNTAKAIKDNEELPYKRKEYLLDSIRRNSEVFVTDFLNERDIIEMSKMADKKIKWNNELLANNIRLYSDKNLAQISVPVFSVDKAVCVYFIRTSFLMKIYFCKKDSMGNWYLHANTWISFS